MGRRNDQHPQRMRVGLHALAGIKDGAVAVKEVPDDAKGDVRVIAQPCVCREDVSESGDENDRHRPLVTDRNVAGGNWRGKCGAGIYHSSCQGTSVNNVPWHSCGYYLPMLAGRGSGEIHTLRTTMPGTVAAEMPLRPCGAPMNA